MRSSRSLSSLVRSVLLAEVRDAKSFESIVIGTDPSHPTLGGGNAPESESRKRLVARDIANRALDFATIGSVASIIVAKGLFKPSQSGSAEAWRDAVVSAWQDTFDKMGDKNDSVHLGKAVFDLLSPKRSASASDSARGAREESDDAGGRESNPEGDSAEFQLIMAISYLSQAHRMGLKPGDIDDMARNFLVNSGGDPAKALKTFVGYQLEDVYRHYYTPGKSPQEVLREISRLAEEESRRKYDYHPWYYDSHLLQAMRFIHYSYELPGPTPDEDDAARFMRPFLDGAHDEYDAQVLGLKEYMRQRSPDAYAFYYEKAEGSPWRRWDPMLGDKNDAILKACAGGYVDRYDQYWKRDYPFYEDPDYS